MEGDAERINRNRNSQAVTNLAYTIADLGYFEKRVLDVVRQAERIARDRRASTEQHPLVVGCGREDEEE